MRSRETTRHTLYNASENLDHSSRLLLLKCSLLFHLFIFFLFNL